MVLDLSRGGGAVHAAPVVPEGIKIMPGSRPPSARHVRKTHRLPRPSTRKSDAVAFRIPERSTLDGGLGAFIDGAGAALRHLVDPFDATRLTFADVTFYGNIDVGASYQTHGAPLSDAYPKGLDYSIAKQNYHSLFSLAPNAASNSVLGLKGAAEIAPGWRGLYRLETQFVPTAASLANGPESLVQNNGRTTLGTGLVGSSSGSDSAKAGQRLTLAYGGVASPLWGSLTFGRQNSLGAELSIDYDPVAGGAANAFSLLAYSSSLSSGFGNTENSHLDNSIKYRLSEGPFHVGFVYKFADTSGSSGGAAMQGGGGFQVGGLAFDALISCADNAVAASSLTAAQGTAAQAGILTSTGIGLDNPGNGLVDATISDNIAFTLAVKYTTGAAQLSGGYESMRFANPAHPFSTGTAAGGYGIYALTANAYDTNKVLQLFWAGLRYPVLSDLDVTLAYYHELQNSFYGASNKATYGCATAVATNCSGDEDNVSVLVDHHVTRRLDIYAGAMLSIARNGLAGGFAAAGASAAGTIDPTVGVRYQF